MQYTTMKQAIITRVSTPSSMNQLARAFTQSAVSSAPVGCLSKASARNQTLIAASHGMSFKWFSLMAVAPRVDVEAFSLDLAELARTTAARNDKIADTHVLNSEFRPNGKDHILDLQRQKTYFNSNDFITLQSLASQKATPLSLSHLYRYGSCERHSRKEGQRLRNAQFLHRELPIRMAQRAVELMDLPYGLSKTRHVQEVIQTYLGYIEKLRRTPIPTTDSEEQHFTNMLKKLMMDRSSIPISIAQGLETLKMKNKALSKEQMCEIEDALYRFFTARVGLRFLAEHHILSKNDGHGSKAENDCHDFIRQQEAYLQDVINDEEQSYLGCIQKDCDPVREVRRVAKQVRLDCSNSFSCAPDIEIVEYRDKSKGRAFTYVPHHLHLMLAEILKNSCRAVVQRYGASKQALPPIRVVVVKGAEDVTIKISDEGGGIPRSALNEMWKFSHSNVDNEDGADSFAGAAGVASNEGDEFAKDVFLNGHVRGFGLPLARIYSRYFGGELTVKSMEGVGVDCYLYLPVLGDSCENLPHRVHKSPGNRDSEVSTEFQHRDVCYIDGANTVAA